MDLVSVIVPLYKGNQYVPKMVKQIEACQSYLRCGVELIISNDYAEEKVQEIRSEKITINILNTEVNRGIHGARVEGLKHAQGRYVWFLDQDDLVNELFLKEQLDILETENTDAVVCKAIREKKQVYDSGISFAKITDLNFMLTVGNYIVSPGQVLIKRDSIPEQWKLNILKNNGVDDWFLWICMLQNGAQFSLNHSILYEHVDDETNASANTLRMFASENEMFDIICKKQILSENQLKMLRKRISALQEGEIRLLEKFKKMFFLYDEWLFIHSSGETVAEYLLKKKVKRVSVYGMGYIGKQLVRELQKGGIKVIYCIDRNADFIDYDIEITREADDTKTVDLYIVAVMEGAESICEEIKKKTDTPALTFASLLKKMNKEIQI